MGRSRPYRCARLERTGAARHSSFARAPVSLPLTTGRTVRLTCTLACLPLTLLYSCVFREY